MAAAATEDVQGVTRTVEEAVVGAAVGVAEAAATAGGGSSDGGRGNDGDMQVQQDTIFVQHLPTNMREDELAGHLTSHFGSIGIIKMDKKTHKPKIWIYKDKMSGAPKGEATVTYDDAHSARAAIDWFNDKDFLGQKIKDHVTSVEAEVDVMAVDLWSSGRETGVALTRSVVTPTSPGEPPATAARHPSQGEMMAAMAAVGSTAVLAVGSVDAAETGEVSVVDEGATVVAVEGSEAGGRVKRDLSDEVLPAKSGWIYE
ncbi:hypothetical protein Bbelb_408560 [Branchiostoma belcheri]|nr:hypothetical protein Bbelb_408560 [Branchiostoma belcheri]